MVTSACNEKCLFCAKAGYQFEELSLRQCLAVLVKKRGEGFNCVVFDGGEPGLRADLQVLLLSALKLGYECIEISTNATAFSSADAMEKLCRIKSADRKKISFAVSLHAHTAAVSDKLTGLKGGFAKTMAGLKNIGEAGFNFGLYQVITAQNYRSLPAYASFIAKRLPKARGVVFSFIFPSGNALRHREIYPKVSAAMPYLLRAGEILQRDGRMMSLSGCGTIPLCMLKGLEMLFVQAYEGANSSNTQVVDSQKTEDFLFFDGKLVLDRKLKTKACACCVLNPICGGLWAIYAERYGLKELKPVKTLQPLPHCKTITGVSFAAAPDEPLNSVLVRLYKSRLNNCEPQFSGEIKNRPDFSKISGFWSAIFTGKTK